MQIFETRIPSRVPYTKNTISKVSAKPMEIRCVAIFVLTFHKLKYLIAKATPALSVLVS